MNGDTYPYSEELPPFPQLWARWSATAAAFAAAGDLGGPRVLPLLAWYADGHDSGSVLQVLPGRRAVLWGEIAGARSATTVPFGYRWEHDRWYPTAPVPSEHCAPALPDIWTMDRTVDTITSLRGDNDERRRAAAVTMVCAAEIGTVTRELVTEVFDDPDLFTADYAMSQFAMAGVLATAPDTGYAPAESGVGWARSAASASRA